MKSELVNHLKISMEAKLLLRAVIEAMLYQKPEGEPIEYIERGINLTRVFINSKLTFGGCHKALLELEEMSMVSVNAHNFNECDLFTKTVLKEVINDAQGKGRGAVGIINEARSSIRKMEYQFD